MLTSKLGQDSWVFKTVYNCQNSGFFVEAGASDGTSLSNTFALEKNGWTGILIEPSPAFNLINQSRFCCTDHRALGKTSDVEEKFLIDFHNQDNRCSAFERYFNLNSIQDLDEEREIVHDKVKTVCLMELLEENKAPNFIEYLSLNIEGAEVEVLESVDFNRYTFGTITISHRCNHVQRSSIYGILVMNGYRLAFDAGIEDWYVHDSVRRDLETPRRNF